ncbi:hypothetical protein MMC27_003062 [Xylographa pallens]|nr:hypothetical protein [Xylographa pallens]
MSCYIYHELQGPNIIRLIQLAPGKPDDPLAGFIELVELDKVPTYVALSYAWEESEKPKILKTRCGSISITSSLHFALRNLRHPKADLCIWADAICINQGDNKEKSSQVRLMGDIYSKAEGVIVDLGEKVPERNLISKGIELIRMLARIPLDMYQRGKNNMIPPWDFEKHGLPQENDDAWQVFGAILACPWFLRVWVVQEFLLGKDVALSCNGLAIPWKLISDALLRCRNHNISCHCYLPLKDKNEAYPKINPPALLGMQAAFELMRKRNTASHGRLPLLNLIESGRMLLATRSRDHMFAFLGLAADARNAAFDADYQESLQSVVVRYAKEFVRVGRGPQIVHSAGSGHEESTFPSWVPDWTNRAPVFLDVLPRNLYQAAGRSTSHMKVVDVGNLLLVHGLIFDKISKVSHCKDDYTLRHETSFQPHLDLLEELDTILSDFIIYPTGEDLHDVYWRTLIGNMSQDPQFGGDILEAPHSHNEQYARWRDFVQKKAKNPNWMDDDQLTQTQTNLFGQLVGRMTNGSRFCVTEKGYVGFCDKKTQCGDITAIFLGCPVPFVIRKFNEREKEFKLIGKSYLYGLMKGEVLSMDGVHEEELILL